MQYYDSSHSSGFHPNGSKLLVKFSENVLKENVNLCMFPFVVVLGEEEYAMR